MDYITLTLVALVLTFVLFKVRQQRYYFSKWGIPQPPQVPFLGIIFDIFYPRRSVNELCKYVYDYDVDAKYVGCHIFGKPTIFIRDLELVKSVLVRNFDYFADHKTFVDERNDPLFGQNLNFLNGDRWKEVRNMLTPSFTASKMRAMYVLMSSCAQNFVEQFVKIHAEEENVDMKDAFTRYSNDVIASCAFGIEVDSLKHPNNEFFLQASNSVAFKGTTLLKMLLEIMFPSLTRKMGLRFVSKETTDFFVNVIETTIRIRDEQNIARPDMLQTMMEARSKMDKQTAAKFDLIEMTAQAFLFFLAGFEASTNQACFIAHELATHPESQKRLQAEVDTLMEASGGKPSYEAINNDMPYLDAVFSETIRRHPIGFLNRICTKQFEFPPAVPGAKPFKCNPGFGIFVPVSGIHSDPKLYSEPELFDPDRFANKKVMTSDVTNLGFGLGPRMCIGNRFAVLVTKALFVHLLSSCTLLSCKKTCMPLKHSKNAFAPVPEEGFWLKFESRS